MINKARINKNLIVGLGGTGMLSIMHTKARCKQIFGNKIPGCIQFLFFDTASLEGPPYPAPLTLVDIKPDFIYMEVTSSKSVVNQNPNVNNSIPERNKKFLGEFSTGAGQMRSRGRLALVSNYDIIKKSLADRLSSISNDLNDDRFEPTEDNVINVYVVTSLAGGTGAGMFVDINYLIREVAGNQKISLNLIYFAPEIFAGIASTDNVFINTYAGLLEYELLSSNCNKNFEKQRETEISLPLPNNKEVKIKSGDKFYDVIIPIDKTNKKGISFENKDQLAEFVGKSLVANFGSAGSKAQGVWNNAVNQIKLFNENEGGVNGMLKRTVGLGYSELYYDSKGMVNYAINELIYHATNKLNGDRALYKNSTNQDVTIWDEFRIKYLDERMQNNQIINEILKTSKEELNPTKFLEQGFKKEDTDKELRKYISEKNKPDEKKWMDESAKNSGKYFSDLLNVILEDYIKKIEKWGINGLKQFAEHIIEELKYLSEELRDEIKKHNSEKDVSENTYKKMSEAELINVIRANSGIFSTDKKRKEKVEEIFTNQNKYRSIKIELIRKEEAVKFIDKLIKYFENELTPYITKVKQNIEMANKKSRLLSNKFSDSAIQYLPFQINIHGDILKALKNNESILDDVTINEAPSKLNEIIISKLDFNKFTEIKSSVNDYYLYYAWVENYTKGNDSKKLSDMWNISIDQAIQQWLGIKDLKEITDLQRKKFLELLMKVKDKSSPLYSYDKDKSGGNMNSVFYLAVPMLNEQLESDSEVLDEEDESTAKNLNILINKFGKEFKNNIASSSGTGKLEINASMDKERYMFFVMEYSTPIAALNNISFYEKEFKTRKNISPFLIKQFEELITETRFTFDSNPSDMVNKRERAMIIWIWGLFLGVIKKDAGNKYLYKPSQTITEHFILNKERIKDRVDAFNLVVENDNFRMTLAKIINEKLNNPSSIEENGVIKNYSKIESIALFANNIKEVQDDLKKVIIRDQVDTIWHKKFSQLGLQQSTLDGLAYKATRNLVIEEENFINRINTEPDKFDVEY